MLVALPMPCPASGSNSTDEAGAAGSAASSAGTAPVPAGEAAAAGEAADAPMLADGEAEIEPEPEPELCLVFLVDGSGAHLHHPPVSIPRPLPACRRGAPSGLLTNALCTPFGSALFLWGTGSVTEEDFRIMTDFMLTAVSAQMNRCIMRCYASPPFPGCPHSRTGLPGWGAARLLLMLPAKA